MKYCSAFFDRRLLIIVLLSFSHLTCLLWILFIKLKDVTESPVYIVHMFVGWLVCQHGHYTQFLVVNLWVKFFVVEQKILNIVFKVSYIERRLIKCRWFCANIDCTAANCQSRNGYYLWTFSVALLQVFNLISLDDIKSCCEVNVWLPYLWHGVEPVCNLLLIRSVVMTQLMSAEYATFLK